MPASPLTLGGDWATHHLGKNYGADQNTQRGGRVLYGTISGRDAEHKRKHVADGRSETHLDLSHRASHRKQGAQQIHHDVVIRDTKYFDQLTSPTRLDSQECCCGIQGMQQSDAVKAAITTDEKVGMEQPPSRL